MPANIIEQPYKRVWTHDIVDPSVQTAATAGSNTATMPAWLTVTTGAGWAHQQLNETTTQNCCNQFITNGSAAAGAACALETNQFRPRLNAEQKFEVAQLNQRITGNPYMWTSRYHTALYFSGSVHLVSLEYRADVNKMFMRWSTAPGVFAEQEVTFLNFFLHDNAKTLGLGWIPNRNLVRVYSEGTLRYEMTMAGHNGATSASLVRAGFSATVRTAETVPANTAFMQYKTVRLTR